MQLKSFQWLHHHGQVKPHLMATLLIQPPRYYGHFILA